LEAFDNSLRNLSMKIERKRRMIVICSQKCSCMKI
jgi:hypothetical protein